MTYRYSNPSVRDILRGIMTDAEKIYELIRSRRSIRNYKNVPIPHDVLDRILDAAIWAPSAMNRQNWKFYILTDEMRDRLANLHKPIFEEQEDRIRERWGEEGVAKRRQLYTNFAGAPVAVVCFTEFKDEDQKMRDIISASLACQNLVLAAWAEGVGSLMMTSSLAMTDEISFLCGVDTDKMALVMVMLLGYPDEDPEAPDRRKKRIVHAETPADIRKAK
jgi:nitroreductase